MTPTRILEVTGSIAGELAVDAFDGRVALQFRLRLRTADGSDDGLVVDGVEPPNVRSWADLAGAVVTADRVRIADGRSVSLAGSARVELGGEEWLALVQRLAFTATGDPTRLGLQIDLTDDRGRHDAIAAKGEVEVGAIRVRSADENRAGRLLDLDRFDVRIADDGLQLHPQP